MQVSLAAPGMRCAYKVRAMSGEAGVQHLQGEGVGYYNGLGLGGTGDKNGEEGAGESVQAQHAAPEIWFPC